jgi:hypothetical protein
MIKLTVVPDEWARPESPADDVPVMLFQGDYVISARRSWQLDAMLAARIRVPGPLILVTGC